MPEETTLTFTVVATDVDIPVQDLTFSLDATSELLDMTITPGGEFAWTPTEDQGPNTYTVHDHGVRWCGLGF